MTTKPKVYEDLNLKPSRLARGKPHKGTIKRKDRDMEEVLAGKAVKNLRKRIKEEEAMDWSDEE